MASKMADAGKQSSALFNFDVVKELLKQQENNFKGFITVLVDNFNKRFDDLSRVVNDIEKSLEHSQQDIVDIKEQIQRSKIEGLETKVNDIEDKLDYLENQSRRNNIRISGLKEERNETWSDTEEKVKSLLNEKLELPTDEITIERAHRTGKSYAGKPRQIVAKFLNYKDREMAIQASKKLKGSGVYINEDFSSRVIKRRKDQQDKLVQARKEGKIAYFNMDKLIIKPRPIMQKNLQPFGVLGASAAFYSYNDDQHQQDEQDET